MEAGSIRKGTEEGGGCRGMEAGDECMEMVDAVVGDRGWRQELIQGDGGRSWRQGDEVRRWI